MQPGRAHDLPAGCSVTGSAIPAGSVRGDDEDGGQDGEDEDGDEVGAHHAMLRPVPVRLEVHRGRERCDRVTAVQLAWAAYLSPSGFGIDGLADTARTAQP